MASIKAAKVSLRNDMKNNILALTTDVKHRQSQEIYKKLLNHPTYKKSQRVSIYLSTDNEISTEDIVKNIFASGKTCFVPRYSRKGMEMVRLHSLKDWETLPVNKWNIKQPYLREERENALASGGLDLVIVPGLAFTANGGRLGHGKGYYDYFLTQLQNNQKHKAFTMGLAFKEQILIEVPTEDHDITMDNVLYLD